MGGGFGAFWVVLEVVWWSYVGVFGVLGEGWLGLSMGTEEALLEAWEGPVEAGEGLGEDKGGWRNEGWRFLYVFWAWMRSCIGVCQV